MPKVNDKSIQKPAPIYFKDFPDKMFAVRKDSPLIVGQSTDGNLIASDVPAILKYTREVYFIENPDEAAKVVQQVIVNKQSRCPMIFWYPFS